MNGGELYCHGRLCHHYDVDNLWKTGRSSTVMNDVDKNNETPSLDVE